MPITAHETTLPGALLLEPRAFPDDRGFFCETYRANELADAGITEAFVQDNHSRSTRGVLRSSIRLEVLTTGAVTAMRPAPELEEARSRPRGPSGQASLPHT